MDKIADIEKIKKEIESLKKEKNALVMAHYYQIEEIQQVADFIGDSLALAQKAATTDADIIVMCGVHFMGETAKILCPDKKVLIPDPEAGCSLADSCNPEELKKFRDENPDFTIVSYVNTTAAVKALTDVVVTSGNAQKVVEQLPKDEKILFGPDRNLGEYINAVTGREMKLWDGACHVHDRFSLEAILDLKKEHPEAKILVHPECKRPLQLIADKVGSTAALLAFARDDDAKEFIVVTESGILTEMQQKCPEKTFIPAPPETPGCACNNCEYMKLNTLEKLLECMRNESPEIVVDKELAAKALRPIKRMLEMS